MMPDAEALALMVDILKSVNVGNFMIKVCLNEMKNEQKQK